MDTVLVRGLDLDTDGAGDGVAAQHRVAPHQAHLIVHLQQSRKHCLRGLAYV